ncbi:uncharacterized protein TRIREDRAFT_102686 [Trichoderma reesei QM6a]|uniref:Predicted protein n=1 Tax=Hypocrea jecorina (strain QM6a) TaxID=431241 RepID=G0R7Y1_HYPJQ|nr:uncharacterized protein TRIREDRAFT_102686 [Trichoderma reesei QM6a]EGR52783.1 predicted protein [Trichoderma reesei QM6a]
MQAQHPVAELRLLFTAAGGMCADGRDGHAQVAWATSLYLYLSVYGRPCWRWRIGRLDIEKDVAATYCFSHLHFPSKVPSSIQYLCLHLLHPTAINPVCHVSASDRLAPELKLHHSSSCGRTRYCCCSTLQGNSASSSSSSLVKPDPDGVVQASVTCSALAQHSTTQPRFVRFKTTRERSIVKDTKQAGQGKARQGKARYLTCAPESTLPRVGLANALEQPRIRPSIHQGGATLTYLPTDVTLLSPSFPR